MPCRATWRSIRVSQEVKLRGNHWPEPLLWNLWEGMDETG